MPAGDSREALFKSYPILFDWVRDNGYRMTWRPHIIAFEDQRRSIVDKQEALRILDEVKENVNVCCAITMEPDEVLVLIDKLESYINEQP